MADYKLSFTAEEIDEKLKKIDDLATEERVLELINEALPSAEGVSF